MTFSGNNLDISVTGQGTANFQGCNCFSDKIKNEGTVVVEGSLNGVEKDGVTSYGSYAQSGSDASTTILPGASMAVGDLSIEDVVIFPS